MAVTHPSSMRNLVADQVTAQVDVGSTFGELQLQAAASTGLVVITFNSTAFAAAAAGVATANALTDGTVTVAGTAAIGFVRSSTQENEVCSCSVTSTGGGGDIELSSNVLSTGQTVSITALTYTAPN